MKPARHCVLDIEAVLDPSIPPKKGSEDRMPPPVAWQIVSIGCLNFEDFEPEQFGCIRGTDERAKVDAFVSYLERDRPVVVTWNGRAFDCPVVGHRALRHCIPMPWWYGSARGPRYRYSDSAIDVKDALADHGASSTGSLDQISRLIGWPGKGEVDGSHVAEMHAAGKHTEIDRYCMQDVAELAAVWLRFELLRGNVKGKDWPRISTRLLSFLEKQATTAELVAKVDRSIFVGANHTGQMAFAE